MSRLECNLQFVKKNCAFHLISEFYNLATCSSSDSNVIKETKQFIRQLFKVAFEQQIIENCDWNILPQTEFNRIILKKEPFLHIRMRNDGQKNNSYKTIRKRITRIILIKRQEKILPFVTIKIAKLSNGKKTNKSS